ncbi:hypothetical protein AHAS_Ahas10G0114700 [Arachis hypogaea]
MISEIFSIFHGLHGEKYAYKKLKSLRIDQKPWDAILQKICEPGSYWTCNTKMAPISLRANRLTKEATMWLYLIFSYVEPKLHFTNST